MLRYSEIVILALAIALVVRLNVPKLLAPAFVAAVFRTAKAAEFDSRVFSDAVPSQIARNQYNCGKAASAAPTS